MPKNDKGQFINFANYPVGTCSLCGGEVLANLVSGGTCHRDPDWRSAICSDCGATVKKNRMPNLVSMEKK